MAPAAAQPLVHRSAIVLLPPRALWPPIQNLRCFNDRAFVRWMPHVNLLYPFIEDGSDGVAFAAAATRAAATLAAMQPFDVMLRRLRHFEHGPRSCTLWLDPESPGGELLALQAALEAAFPACTHLSRDPGRGIARFTPHLSLGQWRGRAAAEVAAAQLGASWQPLTWRADAVALISRAGHEAPFAIRWVVPLGGGQPPVQLDEPYVATVCGPVATAAAAAAAAAAEPGTSIGSAAADGAATAEVGARGGGDAAAPGPGPHPAVALRSPLLVQAPGGGAGVFNFAFGANMAPRKLGGSRGLRPLLSLPARLPGWRLAFSHRGGMGTLVRAPAPAPAPAAAGAPPLQPPQQGLQPPGEAHGVLHLLRPEDMAALACMEHEYEPLEVEVAPYQNGGSGGAAPFLTARGTVRAVAFVTPAGKRIAEGLPPSERYLSLLREGAEHWRLDPEYRAWLNALPSVPGGQRGDAYYTLPDGTPLPALPKTRVGGRQQQQRGRGRRNGSAAQGGGEAWDCRSADC